MFSDPQDVRLGGVKGSGRTARPFDEYLKYGFDFFVSLMALIVISPLLLIIAVLIKIDSPGPVLFSQQREGRNGKSFQIYKFRSMRMAEKPGTGPKQCQQNDPRITRFGNFIRVTSIDEIPQLFNILLGDMSLVGPRPHPFAIEAEGAEVNKAIPNYWQRYAKTPGLTGWAQVNGSRGPLATLADAQKRVDLDIEYSQKASFWFDLKIIFKTVPLLLGDNSTQR